MSMASRPKAWGGCPYLCCNCGGDPDRPTVVIVAEV